MDSVEEFGFSDPENARNYAETGPASFVPGFKALHRTTVQLLSETADTDGTVLVLGAGGGHELQAFTEARPNWNLIAVDPAAAMLDAAKEKLGKTAAEIEWVEGVIQDAPITLADAATCLLTLHVIADDRAKIETLKEVRKRLKPGALFALVDNCIEIGSADADHWLDRYVQYAVDSGFPREQAELFRQKLVDAQTTRSPEQEEQLLRDAGFHEIDLYYVGLSWRGWIARA